MGRCLQRAACSTRWPFQVQEGSGETRVCSSQCNEEPDRIRLPPLLQARLRAVGRAEVFRRRSRPRLGPRGGLMVSCWWCRRVRSPHDVRRLELRGFAVHRCLDRQGCAVAQEAHESISRVRVHPETGRVGLDVLDLDGRPTGDVEWDDDSAPGRIR